LVEQRRTLVGDTTRITNRITDALKQYFSQVLDWFRDKDTVVFCDFLTRWPTLKQAQRARKTRLTAFFHEHHLRYRKIIKQRVQAILSATAIIADPAVIVPNRLLVEVLIAQLRTVLQAVARFDHEIEQLASTLPDYALFSPLPGAGEAFAPRLLAAFGEQRERYSSPAAMQKYVGIALVTERSGNKCWVHWRLQCPAFLRQTFVEWTAQSIPHSYWARAVGWAFACKLILCHCGPQLPFAVCVQQLHGSCFCISSEIFLLSLSYARNQSAKGSSLPAKHPVCRMNIFPSLTTG